MANIYKVGDRLGNNEILFKEVAYITSYGHRYGVFECPICHQDFIAKLYHITANKITCCKKCSVKKRSGFNNSAFKDLTGQKFGKLTVIEYLGNDPSILNRKTTQKQRIWKCKCDCGNEKITTSAELLKHNLHSCGKCYFKSNGEYKIKEILNQLEINFEHEKVFPDCRYKHPLRFDFYLPEKNICIEYDGISHYKSNDFGSWNTEENVVATQERDKIKNNYCKNKGIKLIRIPYTDLEKINAQYLISLIE